MNDRTTQQTAPVKGSATGYKNPPKHGQFKKGVSGNPKGRPRKQPIVNEQALYDLLLSPIEVKKDGKIVQMPPKEAQLRAVLHKALNGGDLRAIEFILKHALAYELLTPYSEASGAQGVVVLPPVIGGPSGMAMLLYEYYGLKEWTAAEVDSLRDAYEAQEMDRARTIMGSLSANRAYHP